MSFADTTWFHARIAEFCEEGREVQLFEIHGQSIFPIYSDNGAIESNPAVFAILRGQGEKAPPFNGAFPKIDGEILDLGNNWIVMCVRLPWQATEREKIAKIQRAEEILRGKL